MSSPICVILRTTEVFQPFVSFLELVRIVLTRSRDIKGDLR